MQTRPDSGSAPEPEPEEAETPEDMACNFAPLTLLCIARLFDPVVIDGIPLPVATACRAR